MGGDDTALGIDFQARVAAWYAAHCICEMPPRNVGANFPPLTIKTIEAESGPNTLDDLYLVLSGGGVISVQSKMRPSRSDKEDSALGKTISQLIRWYIHLKDNNEAYKQEQSKFRAIMAVKHDAPKTLDDLNDFCRFFNGAIDWNTGYAKCKNKGQKKALEIFDTLVTRAWTKAGQIAPCTDTDKVNLARLFHIVRFQLEEGQVHWDTLTDLLYHNLFCSNEAAISARASLLALMNEQIQKRSTFDRDKIMERLRHDGHEDIHTPRYDDDIKKLTEHTTQELDSLKRHRILPLDDGISLVRPCIQPLFELAKENSFFVLGEPGAGKTGTMLDLAELARVQGIPLIFLSVDRFADIPGMTQIESEMKLEHKLADILQNWPVSKPGILLIDALDATRGRGAEQCFRNLISFVTEKLPQKWRIVASIRLFDLKNSQQLRELMPGVLECDEQYKSNEVKNIRHFLIRNLSDPELDELKAKNEKFRVILNLAPAQTRELIRNIFNLSLVAELLQAGEIDPIQFDLKQQATLLKYYISRRIPPDSAIETDFKKAIEYCVEKNQLNIPVSHAQNRGLDQESLLSTGIMYDVLDGPRRLRLLFAHHVLFDYLAAYYFLDWADFEQLQAQLSVPDKSFMLGPALSFVMEIIWIDPNNNSGEKWKLVFLIWRNAAIDQIFKSVAVRSTTVLLADEQDAKALMDYAHQLIQEHSGVLPSDIEPLLARIGAYFSEYCLRQSLSVETVAVWEMLALLAAKEDRGFLDFSYMIMYTLSNAYYNKHACSSSTFNEAARLLLSKARAMCNARSLSSLAVQCVIQSLKVSPENSAAILEELFIDKVLFEKYAHMEAFAIAEGIMSIVIQKPDFVPIIYAGLFGQTVNENETTIVSGRPSALMTLTSTKKQDLDSALWMLTNKIGSLIKYDFLLGLDVVNVSLQSKDGIRYEKSRELSTPIDNRTIIVMEDDILPQEWRNANSSAENNDLLKPLTDFLYKANQDQLAAVYEYLLEKKSCASIWARLLGIVADREDVSLPDLWAFATAPLSRQLPTLIRDALLYIKKTYHGQSVEKRKAWENCLLEEATRGDKKENGVLNRFLSVIDEADLISDAAKKEKNKLADTKQLHGNPPIFSISTWTSPINDSVAFLLERKQIKPTEDDTSLLDICREIERSHTKLINESRINYEEVVALFTELRKQLQSTDFSSREELRRIIRGHLGYALEMLTAAPRATVLSWGENLRDDILATIVEFAQDEHPILDKDHASGRKHWGLYDPRVYAAIGVIQFVRVSGDKPEIIDLIRQLIQDKVPTVRLQIVERLAYLQNIDEKFFLELSKEIAQKENDPYILALFISNIFDPLTATNPQLFMEHLSVIEHRLDEKTLSVTSSDSYFMETMACCSVVLWLKGNDELSRSRLLKWAEYIEAESRYLKFALTALREAFFDGYSDPNNNYQASNIAKKVITLWEDVSSRLLKNIENYASQEKCEQSGLLWEKARNAAEIVDALSMELYLSSGAQSRTLSTSKPLALPTDQAKTAFLNDYEIMLKQLAESGQTKAIYHLIELYAFLLPSRPKDVFDKIALVITGPARKSGFSSEAFAGKVVIDIVRTCLADYRDIFEDTERRQNLVEVLNVFSDSGWPKAIQLLYDLPELFR